MTRRTVLMFAAFCACVALALGLRAFRPVEMSPAEDVYGRLTYFPGKTMVACPKQDARTAVVLVVGQSNVANQGEALQMTAFGDRVTGFFDGACSVAASPLLGATGTGGESLTPMADALIHSGRYDRVVLVPVAVGGSEIERWEKGDLTNMLLRAVDRTEQSFKLTHMIWNQGESDGAVSAEDYTKSFRVVLAALRAHGLTAPVFVSVATRCTILNPGWEAGNPVARAQLALPDPGAGLYPGPDTDALIPAEERMDRDCHFKAAGQAHFGELLARALLAGPATAP